ncbi:hypothetical protein LTR08_003880 [Meristemomyces frigidus]|nr:hypothetical protein LTR08_003880 [Meristemomyces frigidus]
MIEGPLLNQSLDHVKESDVTSKLAKRRSLLPHFARKEVCEEKDTIREGVETEHVIVPSTREPRRAMEETDRRAMPPPSKLGRPTSTYGASGLGRAPSVRSHAREPSKSGDARADALAKLTGSATSAMPRVAPTPTDTGLTRTSSSRLPQGPAPRGLSRTTSVKVTPREPNTTTTTRVAEKRASVVDKGVPVTKRPSVSRPRPPSIDTSLRTHAPSAPSPASPASSTTSRQSMTKGHMLPPPRPSFSTHQQHYSPAKSALPKPPLPSTRAARSSVVPVTETEAPVSFEESKQQIELLQLSLLHQASFKTLQDYEASAKRKLSKKQTKLRKECDAIKGVELDQQRIANLGALDAWCRDPALLVEHLQILSKVHSEVCALAEEGSRYAQLVTMFERWADDAETAATQPSDFVEALSSDWHKTHTSLSLRTRSLQREMDVLPRTPASDVERPSSSLEMFMRCCKELLDGMLRELEVMTKIEKGVLEREKRRVEGEVKGLAALDSKQPWVPAWQSIA